MLFGVATGVVDGGGDEAGLQAREAAHAPLGVGNLADEFEFERVGGLDVGFESRELAVEVGWVLAGQYGIAGEESVFEGVFRNAGLAFLGARSGGFLGVVAISFDLCTCGHGYYSFPGAEAPIPGYGGVTRFQKVRCGKWGGMKRMRFGK